MLIITTNAYALPQAVAVLTFATIETARLILELIVSGVVGLYTIGVGIKNFMFWLSDDKSKK